jgi:hypothetical protein
MGIVKGSMFLKALVSLVDSVNGWRSSMQPRAPRSLSRLLRPRLLHRLPALGWFQGMAMAAMD